MSEYDTKLRKLLLPPEPDEPKYAVYVIVIEDTELAFQEMCSLPLSDWRQVDDNLTEQDAIELAATCG